MPSVQKYLAHDAVMFLPVHGQHHHLSSIAHERRRIFKLALPGAAGYLPTLLSPAATLLSAAGCIFSPHLLDMGMHYLEQSQAGRCYQYSFPRSFLSYNGMGEYSLAAPEVCTFINDQSYCWSIQNRCILQYQIARCAEWDAPLADGSTPEHGCLSTTWESYSRNPAAAQPGVDCLQPHRYTLHCASCEWHSQIDTTPMMCGGVFPHSQDLVCHRCAGLLRAPPRSRCGAGPGPSA